MKKLKLNLTVIMLPIIALSIMFSSCSSSKKLTATPEDEVLVSVYCSSDEYLSDSKALRFSSIGESMNQMTAKNKALTEARAGLAASTQAVVKRVTDNYTKSNGLNNKEELMQKWESLNREVINQTLVGSVVVCEKTTKTKTGNYKSYICMELGGEDILSSINNRMSNDEMLKVDYNYEKFKKTFEEEMNKMGN